MKKTIIQLVVNNTSCIRRDYARILLGAVVACWLIAAGTAKAQWSENFDAYANGSQAIGQGGWQGWDGDTTVGGLVTNAFAFSAPNSVRIYGTATTSGNYSDLVHQFSGYTSGQWIFSARVYIPSTSTTGTSFFILLDNYSNGGPNNWAIQTHFDLAAGNLVEDNGTSVTLPIIRNQWVELRYLIDLTANTVSAYYNNTLLSTHVWQTGANGLNEIRAIDLYSDVSSPVFYDNISLTRAHIVTTTASTGPGSLTAAINALSDGDTIRFNIPGPGPHYLVSPTGGYPAITNKHNVTIDGYSQPGSSPNTNPILSSNNASIKIVLTATNGELTVLDIPGYGTGESAVLFVYGSSNFTVRGLCLLGPGGNEVSPSPYAVAFAYNGADAAHNGHVAGCRIGLDLNGTTIARFKDAVAGFGPGPINGTVVGVGAGPADTAAARAQFNIIMAMHIPVILEGNNYRISGNFFNVYPDGLHDFLADGGASGPEHTLEAFMEFGGNQHHSLLIGTDGDGVNDAEERNIFGGVTFANDNRLLEWYSGGAPRTNIVIAGNYFGVGVDGVTRFTNSMKVFNGFNATATVQFGSDFNGVSDALEGNVISMNHPFDVVFSDPTLGVVPIFGDLSTGTRLSLRGNKLMGNNNPPFSWADGTGGRLTAFTNYSAPYMSIEGSIIPALSPSSTHTNLIGTCAPTNGGDYSNIIVDVYVLDSEGWENGKKIAGARAWIELTDNATFTNGFPQGRTYLGSFVDNGPFDSNPAVGSFNFNTTSLGLALGTQITVTANYSQDPPGTTRGRTHTSNFANPVTLRVPGTIYVTSTDNSSPNGLAAAINLAGSGDTIAFNIPGAGPHYLVSPTGGYPAITNKHNVTIDGYTQTGASPNTNPILSSNNASIKIVLTATNGELTVLDIPGYGTGESAVLFVYGSSNFTVRGLCLLGPGGNEVSPSPYAVAFAYNGADAAHNGHVAGCRIGLDLNGTTIARFKDAVAGFGPGPINGTVVGVGAGPADAAAARAQFNIIMAMHIPVILEGNNYRISGNFFNVYPDGLHDFLADGTASGPEHTLEAFMEFGGNQHHSLLIGTDGDGVNDAEERNIFGGVTFANDNRLLEWYSGGAPRTNIVIAGNYFGVGVDGVTRFTNSMKVFNGFNATATVQFGSDFNGVSDALEGNVISMNHPFDVLFADPGAAFPVMPIFGDLSTGTRLSLRGNKLMGNNNPPFSWADGTGGRLTAFTNYSAPYMSIEGSLIPVLSSNSTVADIIGTCAPTNGGAYSNIIVDVYVLDSEGWDNGKKIAGARAWIELTDNATFTNGFPQGRTYLGSFVDNGPLDRDATVGRFNFNSASLGVTPGTQVTVAANYSQDPAGTTRGRTHTSQFSNPTTLRPAVRITSISRTGSTLTISWTGGSAPYTLQKRSPITGAWGNVTTGIAGTSTTDTISGTESYYRVLGN